MRHSSEPTTTRWRSLSLFLILAASVSTLSPAQQTPVKPKPIPVSTHKFALQKEGDSFFLQPLPSTPQHPRIAIPRELIPKQETDDPEDSSPVDPFNYDRRVTSFPIGNGDIGLRLSSFDAMTEGSMQLAQGKDVFLIYNPTSGKLRPGGFDLGITKERIWGAGCFHAQMVHLLVGDSNEDGLTDIGVVKEEIWCPEIRGEPELEDEEDPSAQKPPENKLPPELENIAAIPLYQQHNAIWYLYTPQGWKLDPDQGTPENYSELPLIGIVLSPVDFVASFLWRSYDPKSWIDPPRFVPAYRKKLIAGPPLGPRNSPHPPKSETGPRK